ADGIKDDVGPGPPSDVEDRVAEIRLRVVDAMVGAMLPGYGKLLCASRRGDYGRTERLADLHGGEPAGAGGPMHQQDLARLHPRPPGQRAIAGGVDGRKLGRRVEAERVRNAEDIVPVDDRLLGEPT